MDVSSNQNDIILPTFLVKSPFAEIYYTYRDKYSTMQIMPISKIPYV